MAISGPAGSGKSSVGEKVAKKLERCANIDVDHVKHMIVSGFYKDQSNPAGWGFDQWGLVGDSIGILASNFAKEGYSVVINGYLDEPAWSNIQKHAQLTHKVLLLPQLETAIKQDAARLSDKGLGEESVKEHYRHFSNGRYYQSFKKLDTTNQSVEETVDAIVGMLS